MPVVGTALSVTGAPSLVIGSQGTYNVSLTDSSGKPIAAQSVALTSSAGNTLSAASVTTDVSGHATFQLTATKAGTDTVTVKALGLTATQAVVVSGQSFTFTSPAANTKVNLGASLTLIVNWKSTGTPQVGQTVNFASTRGTLAPAIAVTTRMLRVTPPCTYRPRRRDPRSYRRPALASPQRSRWILSRRIPPHSICRRTPQRSRYRVRARSAPSSAIRPTTWLRARQ